MKKLMLLLALLGMPALSKAAPGDRVFDKNVIINGTLEVNDSTALNGPLAVSGNIAVNNNKFNVNANTGRTAIAGPLNVAGVATFNNDVIISGGSDLRVTGSTLLLGQLIVNHDSIVFDSNGSTTFNSSVNINNDAYIARTLYANEVDPIKPGKVTIFKGDVHLNKTLDVKQSTTLEGTLDVYKNVLLHEFLRVFGPALFSDDVSIRGNLTVTGTTNLHVNTQPQKLAQKSVVATAGSSPSSVAFSPLGDFVAVVSNGNVEIFGVDNSGNLLESAISTYASADNPTLVAWSPNWSLTLGGFIAVINFGSRTVQIFGVDADGNLSSPISSQATGFNPNSVGFSALGNFIVVTNQVISSTNVQMFGVDDAGNLTAIISTQGTSPFAPEAAAWSPNWSPTTGTLFAIATKKPSIQVNAVDASGIISSPVSSQFTASEPKSLAFSPFGDYVAVVNSTGATVQIFSVDDLGNISSGAISSQTTGSSPAGVAWSPDWSFAHGGHVAITSRSSSVAEIFKVDASGNLSSKVGYANTGYNPQAVAWSPTGELIVVANSGTNTIQTFDVSAFLD